MSQRLSGYDKRPLCLYDTPDWVTRVLLPHLPPLDVIWEPACGAGQMVRVLEEHALVLSTDVAPPPVGGVMHDGLFDFLRDPFTRSRFMGVQAIVTNPPYDHATAFIERALEFFRNHQERRRRGTHRIVAMLLRVDFDSAVTRRHLFGDCPQFSKKIVLRKRIKWFEADGPGKSPSENHAWLIWDWRHQGPPTIAYEPRTPMVEDKK